MAIDESTDCEFARGYDPHDPDVRADPFPTFRRLRQCPVSHSEHYDGFWAVSRYEDVYAALRDPETFSSAAGGQIPELGNGRPQLPIDADPPDHTPYRRVLMPRFTREAIAEFEDFTRETVHTLVDEFVERGSVDLRDLAVAVPMQVVCRMLGIPPRPEDFQQWEHEIFFGRVHDPEAGLVAADRLYGVFREELERRRSTSDERDDLIGLLMKSEIDDRPYTDDEILDSCVLLLLAGLDNTSFAIWQHVSYLALHPDLRSQVRDDRSLVAPLIEEMLRMYTPVQGLGRTVTHEVDLGGSTLRAGDRLLLLFASANRDESEFDQPDEFVLGREPNRHLAFGAGIHRCLGSWLARMEIKVVIETFLDRVPQYAMAEPEKFHFQLGQATSLILVPGQEREEVQG